MQETVEGPDIEERLARLERRVEETTAALFEDVRSLDNRLGRLAPSGERVSTPVAVVNPAAATRIASRRPPMRQPTPRPVGAGPAATGRASVAASETSLASSASSLADLVGGRVLAWIGGVATLVGIVLFLALAISHGWIDREMRVGLAAVASCGLMASGIWLHGRRGRTEASIAMVGAATAGLFATLIVASQVYHLIPSPLALAAALLVGALATSLAIRWAGVAVGSLGLVGGLISPVLVGASPSATTIAVLAVAGACATWVVIRMRWAWLGLATVLVCAPQWASWLLAGQAVPVDVGVLAVFGAMGLIGAAATQRRTGDERLHPASAALAALSACVVAVIGRITLDDASGSVAAEGWLAALAGAHAIVGCWRAHTPHLSEPMRRLLIVIGVVLADVAFALTASGITLAGGWAAAATAFAWGLRRTAPRSDDERLLGMGIGAHVALTLTRAVIDAPASALGGGDAQLLPLLSVSLLAASCLGAAHLIGQERRHWAIALNILGLGAIAYLTAGALTGSGLVCAWGLEALALARLAGARRDAVASYGAFGFLGLAALHVIIAEAPPTALLRGVSSLSAAAIGLGAIALVTFLMALAQPSIHPARRWLLCGSATALLYLASIAIVTAFQPVAGTTAETVVDLSVQQQGQVLLSALWCVVGLAALVVGLKRKQATVRGIALGWLLLTVGKVFLYDVATLTSIYRVISFIVAGLLLLAGAFAYQRLRPPPPPDMRTVHPSQL
jgi:uncharacterized membrane protein